MNLHTLPAEVKCTFCGKGGLAFVGEGGSQGDLYHSTAATSCRGLSFHCRTRRGCGVSAETAGGQRLNWMACLTPERPPLEETEEHLTTLQAAVRLRVSKKKVIGLVSHGKLPGRKIGARWLMPAEALRLYNQTATVRHRVSGG